MLIGGAEPLELAARLHDTGLIGRAVHLGTSARLREAVLIGGAVPLEASARLRDTVLLGGAVPSEATVRVRDRLGYAARAGKAIALQPYEGIERTLERVAERQDERGEGWHYEMRPDGDEHLHHLLGSGWPCSEERAFDEVWQTVLDDLHARGLVIGRGSFDGWDDGDIRLARLAWCMARHLRPSQIIETGVGRGLTSRMLLEALERNGSGHLWSIDLPPLIERDLARETGCAVPERLRKSWTLIRGSSRRRLPRLIAQLGRVDMFVHDSMHTTRNLRFELSQVWSTLAPGGAVLIDDVERNSATGKFLERHPGTPAVFSRASDGDALLGCLVKPSG